MGTWGVIGLMGSGSRNGEEATGPYYAESVSTNLHSWLLMEQTQLKEVDILRQGDWSLLQQYLEDLC